RVAVARGVGSFRLSSAAGTGDVLRDDDHVHCLRLLRGRRVVGRQVYVAGAWDAHSWGLRHGERPAMRFAGVDRRRIDGLCDSEAPGQERAGGGSSNGVNRGSRIEDCAIARGTILDPRSSILDSRFSILDHASIFTNFKAASGSRVLPLSLGSDQI